jgi:hypothetical protein
MWQAAENETQFMVSLQVQRPIVVVRAGKTADGFGRHFKRVAPFARARVVPAAVQWSGAVACIQPQLPAETQINDVFYTRLRQTFPSSLSINNSGCGRAWMKSTWFAKR